MRHWARTRSLVGAFLMILGICVPGAASLAYMGGAIRAHVAGFEPATNRVYYYLTYHDESGAGPEVWFFDLDGDYPSQPNRAPYFEGSVEDYWRSGENVNKAWQSLSVGLIPLPASDRFDLRISWSLDSVGVDSDWGSDIFDGHLTLDGNEIGQASELRVFCEPMMSMRALYSIPGRREAVAVITYIGRSYGCEEVELPVLLTAAGAEALSRQAEPTQREARVSAAKQVIFDKRQARGCCANQFVGYYAQSLSSPDSLVWYLSWYEVMLTKPQLWSVSLNGNHPKEPIRIDREPMDSMRTGWEEWDNAARAEGRRSKLYSAAPVDLTLHLRAERMGVDSLMGAPRYACEVSISTPTGSGRLNLTTFCSTLIQARGVFSLPEDCRLLVLTYTGEPAGCKETDVPLVVYPK